VNHDVQTPAVGHAEYEFLRPALAGIRSAGCRTPLHSWKTKPCMNSTPPRPS
jgi:hypothetical protein